MKLENAKDLFRKNKNKIMVNDYPEIKKVVNLEAVKGINVERNLDDGLIKIKSSHTKYVDKITGKEKPIKTEIIIKNDVFYSGENNFDITIDKTLGAKKGFLINDGIHSIQLIPAAISTGIIDPNNSSKVVFNNILDNDSLQLIVKENGIDIDIFVNTQREVKYNFNVITTGLISSINTDGTIISFLDKTSKEKVFIMDNFFMNDSNEVMTNSIAIQYTEISDDNHSLMIAPNKIWIEEASRQFPIIISGKLEVLDQPVIALTPYVEEQLAFADREQIVLGIKNKQKYSFTALVNVAQIVHEITYSNLKQYIVNVELHYKNGIRIDSTKGFVVYSGSNKLLDSKLNYSESNILVNITEIIKSEVKKYKAGQNVSNIKLTFMYKEQNINIGYSDLDSYAVKCTIVNDFIIVKDRFAKEECLRPELHLECSREDEVTSGTPFLSYDTNKGGISKINLFSNAVGHSLDLGSIVDNSLNIGIKLIYDSRYLCEQLKNKQKNFFGRGWFLNLNQRLVKGNNYSKLMGGKDIIFYDGENNAHILTEKRYYEKDDVRHYILKDKVYLDNDQKLKYKDLDGNVYKVEYEASNDEGLTLISTNSKMNYVKKSDMKVNKRYFITIGENQKREVYFDGNGCLRIPHFYESATSISNMQGLPEFIQNLFSSFISALVKTFETLGSVTYKNSVYLNSSGVQLRTDYISRQLFYKNGKYYVKGLKHRYDVNTGTTTHLLYEDYEDEARNIEIIVEKEFYVSRDKPLVDYYETEDITNINSQITQTEDYLSQLENQVEASSNTFYRLEKEINHQILMRKQNLKINEYRDEATEQSNIINDETIYYYDSNNDKKTDTTKTAANKVYRKANSSQVELSDEYQTESSNYSLNSLQEQLKEQQKFLRSAFKQFETYETQLINLKERKDALVADVKDSVQDYIMDSTGSIMGFDYYGRLVYITDSYENEVVITIDDNKITEIASKNQKMVFYYNDDNFIETVIDTQGRRKEFVVEGEKLTKINFLAENNEKQCINFGYYDSRLSKISDSTHLTTLFTYVNSIITSVIQRSDLDEITSEHLKTKLTDILINNSIKKYGNYVNITDELTGDVTEYHFDTIGRLVTTINKDSQYGDSYSFTHFDEKNLLFTSNYDAKNLIRTLLLTTSLSTNPVTQNIIISDTDEFGIKPKTFVLTGSVFAMLDLSSVASDDLSMCELTIKAVVTKTDGTTNEFIQVYNDFTCRYVGLPIQLNQKDIAVSISVFTNKTVKSSTTLELQLFEAEIEVLTYNSKDNPIKSLEGYKMVEYLDYVDDQPTTIKTVDKFGVTRTSHKMFDSAGRIVYEEDYLGNAKEYAYDTYGHTIQTREYNKTAPTMAKISNISYDENGNATEFAGVMRDEKGEYPQEKVNYIPNISKISSMKTASGQVICYGYDFNTDEVLEISSDTLGQANATKMRYRFGLLTSVSHHDFTIDYTLDNKGRKRRIDVAGTNIIKATFEDNVDTYSKQGSIITTITNLGYEEVVASDKKGQKILIKNNEGDQIHYKYDDRLKTEILRENDNTHECVETKYLEDGRLTLVAKVSENGRITYTFKYNNDETICEEIITINGEQDIVNHYEYDESIDKKIRTIIVDSDTAVNFKYDALLRTTNKKILFKEKVILEDEIEYLQYAENSLDLVKEHNIKVNGKLLDTAEYTYDVSGNITSFIRDEFNTRYSYDKLNRLVREDNPRLNKTITYKYDNGGNLLLLKEFDYTIEDKLVGGKPHHFTYATEGWKDQLIDFDGNSIVYDSMGRPTSIDGMTTEFNGRGLMTRFGDTKFTYDIDEVRKSVSTISCGKTFLTIGNKILKEASNGALNYELMFEYAMDRLIGFEYNNIKYFFIRNIQGDIQRIYRKDNCELVVEYVYDAWGNHKVLDANGVENNDVMFIGNINPFRYRGYYYDRETNLYYLNSRYYSPELCRFISPDTLSILDETHAQINGLNLYMYCNDNPVMNVDPSGMDWNSFWGEVGNWFKDNWIKLTIGVGAITLGALTMGFSTLISGAGLAIVFSTMGTAAVSSLIQVGISTAISASISMIIGGIKLRSWDGALDEMFNGIADGFMRGGIFAGTAQIIGGALKITRALAPKFNGQMLGNIKLWSPNSAESKHIGGTLLKFGSFNRIDFEIGNMMHLHLKLFGHIYNHLPIGMIGSGIIGGFE